MSKLGVLSNVHSRRNSRSMSDFNAVLSANPGIVHLAFHKFAAMPHGLRTLAQQGVDHLIVSGGDGTVHAVITELLLRSPFPKLPKLSLLAGGTTNVIARDVANVRPPAWAMKEIIEGTAGGHPGEVITRDTMGLRCSDWNEPIYGFLAGAIGFYQGTMLSRGHVNHKGTHQVVIGSLSVVRALARVLYHGFGEKSGIKPERVELSVDNAAAEVDDFALVLATTLNSLVPGVMPFWGTGDGRIKLTTISSPYRRFACAAWWVARGKPRPWLDEAGYRSRRADQIGLRLTTPLIMDGETFEPGPEGRAELSAGPSVSFVRY